MAEQFLTLMADLDEESQAIMGEWSDQLKKSGFIGMQTPGLPFHISHIGMFAGGKVLFGAPDMNPPGLVSLREAISVETSEKFPWTPHATIMIDESETICRALPILLESFYPFVGKITRLHLCAFWPTREITSVDLCEL